MAHLPALGARPRAMLAELHRRHRPHHRRPTPVFISATGQPLTRFGIYKIVRRHAGHLDDPPEPTAVSPHTFRHTAAVHLLEAGVEVNVIRGWLGHADLTTTNRYAEINTKAKIASAPQHRTTGFFGGTPAATRSGGPTKRCSTGSRRSDRYVPRLP